MKAATLDQNTCQEITLTLGQVLANTYLLLVKTQNFHWNVVDPRFSALHKFFEEQYTELQEANDELAERIRMLGQKTPASMRQFLELGSIEESEENLNGDEMLRQLLDDHDYMANIIRPQISDIQKMGDEGTADLLIQRLRAHEKAAWMLRSHFRNLV